MWRQKADNVENEKKRPKEKPLALAGWMGERRTSEKGFAQCLVAVAAIFCNYRGAQVSRSWQPGRTTPGRRHKMHTIFSDSFLAVHSTAKAVKIILEAIRLI